MAIRILLNSNNNSGLLYPASASIGARGEPLTVAGWIRPTGLGSGSLGRVIGREISTNGWSLAMTTGGSFQFQCSCIIGTTLSGAVVAHSTQALTIGTTSTAVWQHICATWDGTIFGAGIQLYYNGVATGTTNITNGNVGSQPVDYTVQPIGIGNRQGAGRNFWGDLAEIGVWSGILPLADIQALAKGISPRRIATPKSRFIVPLVRQFAPLNTRAALDTGLNSAGVTIVQHPRTFA